MSAPSHLSDLGPALIGEKGSDLRLTRQRRQVYDVIVWSGSPHGTGSVPTGKAGHAQHLPCNGLQLSGSVDTGWFGKAGESRPLAQSLLSEPERSRPFPLRRLRDGHGYRTGFSSSPDFARRDHFASAGHHPPALP